MRTLYSIRPGFGEDSKHIPERAFLHQPLGVCPGRGNRNRCPLLTCGRKYLHGCENRQASITLFRGNKDLRSRVSITEEIASTEPYPSALVLQRRLMHFPCANLIRSLSEFSPGSDDPLRLSPTRTATRRCALITSAVRLRISADSHSKIKPVPGSVVDPRIE